MWPLSIPTGFRQLISGTRNPVRCKDVISIGSDDKSEVRPEN